MQRLWLLPFALVVILAGCSGHTTTTLNIDLASFITAQGFDSGTLSPVAGTAYLPPGEDGRVDLPDSGQLLQLPGLEALEHAAVAVRLELTNPDTVDSSLSLTVYIAPESETNIYQEIYRVGQAAQAALSPGGAGTLEFSLALSGTENPEAFNRVRSGSFRVGLKLEHSGAGTVEYTITVAELSVSGRLFALIPDA